MAGTMEKLQTSFQNELKMHMHMTFMDTKFIIHLSSLKHRLGLLLELNKNEMS